MDSMIDKIFLDLSTRFQKSSPLTNADVSELPFRALRLITRLGTTAVALKSYELFKVIIQSATAPERKMEAARLALRAAYCPGLKSLPPVGDPKHVLDFLRYHIDSQVKMEDRTHAIASAMRAIDSTYGNRTTTWCIENADDLTTWFQGSSDPKKFEWWYGILWLHYGGLDSGIRERMDEIAMSSDDRFDLKWCRVLIEKETERVKELDGASDVMKSLDDAYTRLTALIDHRERVRGELLGFQMGLIFFPPVPYTGRVCGYSSYRTRLPAITDTFFHRSVTVYTLRFPCQLSPHACLVYRATCPIYYGGSRDPFKHRSTYTSVFPR